MNEEKLKIQVSDDKGKLNYDTLKQVNVIYLYITI